MRRHRLLVLATPVLLLASLLASPSVAAASQTTGTQSDAAYAASAVGHGVTNVFATSQKTSCYTPEVPYFRNLGPNDGYDGMTPCAVAANTGENLGPYASQAGSNPGYPATTPMLVKNHSESDVQVDPTNPSHLIGTSKWFVSAEGYNHLLGFYESFDGGTSWPVQGHVPGFEGWTDNTDPVGAFDSYGNFYFLDLPYHVNASIQFYRANLLRAGHNIRLSQHAFDPQLNSPHTSCADCVGTFIGDYFGNTISGSTSVSTFVSTYAPGNTNPNHYQEQVVALLTIP